MFHGIGYWDRGEQFRRDCAGFRVDLVRDGWIPDDDVEDTVEGDGIQS